jgi:nucleoside-diphosphate-sugar epimerase
MKIVITGSRGFLGTELVKLCKKKGYTVVECDLILRHDITDKKSMTAFFNKNSNIDACVHLAAVSNLNLYDLDEKQGHDINVLGTKILMDLCVTHDIKMYVGSTCCLYGDNNLAISDETSAVSPTEAYAVSKQKCEDLIVEYNKKNDKKQFTAMRLATFYGGRYVRGALCIPKFIDLMSNGKTLCIHGDGSMARTYTHVLDMVSGIETLVSSGHNKKLPYTVYNVTDNEAYSVWDIVTEVAKHLPVDTKFSIKMETNRPIPFTQCHIKSDRLKKLGWSPKMGWVAGIKEAVHSYKLNGNKWNK